MDLNQFSTDHIIGAAVGFVAGYLARMITGKIVKYIIYVAVLLAITVYFYAKNSNAI
ncbi:MAG: hypothetical protein AAB942_00055 [Patescibacteria group bacterium]